MIFSTRLQEILKRFKTGEITISVRDDNSPNTGKETKRQYEARLLQSIKELDEGKGIQFPGKF